MRLSCMCMRLLQRWTHVLVDSKSWRPEIVVVKLFIVFYTRRAVTLESDATIQRSLRPLRCRIDDKDGLRRSEYNGK